jgi:hypothetical protein
LKRCRVTIAGYRTIAVHQDDGRLAIALGRDEQITHHLEFAGSELNLLNLDLLPADVPLPHGLDHHIGAAGADQQRQ